MSTITPLSTSALLGPAPIVDFDGTMAFLPVDWTALRRALGVGSVAELWTNGEPGQWATVTEAEFTAVSRARPIVATLDALAAARAFVVITDNDESVVAEFLSAYPALAAKTRAVFGRQSHGGPKRDREVFARAFSAARQWLGDIAPDPVYCGDQDYELDFARALGAGTVRVRLSGELEAEPSVADAQGRIR
jgi:hypothetical protein